MNDDHEHNWKHDKGLMFVCDCNTITTLTDLLAKAKRQGYVEGVKKTYRHLLDNRMLNNTGKTEARKLFQVIATPENERLL